MSKLTRLKAELDEARNTLADALKALDKYRATPNPQRAELARLHGLVAEARHTIESIDADIDAARIESNSTKALAERAAGRARRALALDGAEQTKALARIERALAEAIEAAAVFTAQSQARALHANAVAWLAHAGDQAASRNVSGNAVTVLTGTDRHALAIAQRINDFLRALPAPLRSRLAGDYSLQPSAIALSGRARITLADAAASAEADLQHHIAKLLDEPQPSKVAA